MGAYTDYQNECIRKATSGQYESLNDFTSALSSSIRETIKGNNIIISMDFAKRLLLSFKRRLKKDEERLENLKGKWEVDGLEEEELDQKEILEREIEELREILKAIK